ncbi:hypothetical protein AMJ85_04175 [candidate division BRC1 bacterium SM23_51]|nr:MAG: hypothetical protein AMJ85_04175 [candidate division BRC1 bacterium SM23_51]
MAFTVALIHTRLRSVDLFNREISLHLPHVFKFNILDETILFEAVQNGLTPRILDRLVQHYTWAERMKAHVILNTSTILEPAVPSCQEFVSIPILRLSEPMCDQAVSEGSRICILGNLEQATAAVAGLLEQVAARRERKIQIMTKHVLEAAEQLDMGDWDMHNRLVVEAVREVEDQCDVLIIPQISLQPLLPALKREIDVPVLGSAEPIIARLAKMARERTPTPPPQAPGTTASGEATVV